MNCDDELIDSILRQYGHDIKSLDISSNGIEKLSALYRLGDTLLDLKLSQNAIKEISELSELRNLRRLDLQSNIISSLNGLDKLSQLETLDLRWNRIESLNPLIAALDRLPNIRVLLLEGNSVCKSPEYPICLFNASKSLKIVDIWNKDGFEVSTDRSVLSDIMSPTSSCSLSSTKQDVYDAEIASLKMQINSLESALKIQEKVLSNHQKKSSSAIADANSNQFSGQFSNNGFGSLQSASGGGTLASGFCYEKLLNLWRRQCQAAFIKCQFSDKQVDSLSVERKHLMELNTNMKQEMEAKLLSMKGIQNKLAEANQILHSSFKISEENLKLEKEKNYKMQELVSNLNQKNLKQKELLIELCRSVEKNNFLLDIMGNKVMSAISDSDARLLALATKTESIKASINQHQVQLRNNWAEFELEKSLFSTKPPQSSSFNVNKSLGNSYGGAGVESECIDLSPECESILRTVYKTVDDSNSGCVDCSALLRIFRVAQTISKEDSSGVDKSSLPTFANHIDAMATVIDKFVDKTTISMMCTRLESFVKSRRGSARTNNHRISRLPSAALVDIDHEPSGTSSKNVNIAIDNHKYSNVSTLNSKDNDDIHELASKFESDAELPSSSSSNFCSIIGDENYRCNKPAAAIDITWGELLSIFLRPNSNISHHEYYDLMHRGYLGDDSFAMLPLDLSSSPAMLKSASDAKSSAVVDSLVASSSGGRADKLYKVELHRLSVEREFMLQKIQQMNRSLEKRVTSVRLFFEDELEKGKFRESKLSNELNDHQSEIFQLKSRIELLEVSSREKQVFYDSVTQSLREENTSLKDTMLKNEKEYMQGIKTELELSQNNLIKAETECSALLIESSKKDSKIKTLLRETLRMQSILTKHVEENSKVTLENTSLKDTIEILRQELEVLRDSPRATSEQVVLNMMQSGAQICVDGSDAIVGGSGGSGGSGGMANIVTGSGENDADSGSSAILIEEMSAIRKKLDDLVGRSGLGDEKGGFGIDASKENHKNFAAANSLTHEKASLALENISINSSNNSNCSSGGGENSSGATNAHSNTSKQTLSQQLAKLVRLAEDAINSQS